MPNSARTVRASEPHGQFLGRGSEAHYKRAVTLLSFGFFGVFTGFNAAQGLQTSLNATLGNINLATLYGMFTILCLVAPPLLAKLERGIGMRMSMVLGGAAYAAMCFANLVSTPEHAAPIWAFPICMNMLVGVMAPVLWTFQNDYVCRGATHAALERQDEGQEVVEAAKRELTTRFNGVFFSYFQFAGMFGTFIASAILLALSSNDFVKEILFVVLGSVALLGALSFLLMPPLESVGTSDHPTLLDTAKLALSSARVGLLIPLMFANGMTLAFMFGDFQAEITCPVVGPGFTGFVLTCFYGVNSVASQLWSRAIAAGRLSRRNAYIFATVCIVAFLLACLLWEAPAHFERDSSAGGTGWKRIPGSRPPSAGDTVIVFLLAALFALGDAFYESGPAATLQTFFSGTPDLVPALANYKLWQSLGFATQFFLGVVLSWAPHLRCYLLLGILVLGLASLLYMDCCTERLDVSPGDRAQLQREQRCSGS